MPKKYILYICFRNNSYPLMMTKNILWNFWDNQNVLKPFLVLISPSRFYSYIIPRKVLQSIVAYWALFNFLLKMLKFNHVLLLPFWNISGLQNLCEESKLNSLPIRNVPFYAFRGSLLIWWQRRKDGAVKDYHILFICITIKYPLKLKWNKFSFYKSAWYSVKILS